jgi:hypothetical protein
MSLIYSNDNNNLIGAHMSTISNIIRRACDSVTPCRTRFKCTCSIAYNIEQNMLWHDMSERDQQKVRLNAMLIRHVMLSRISIALVHV